MYSMYDVCKQMNYEKQQKLHDMLQLAELTEESIKHQVTTYYHTGGHVFSLK